MTWPWHAFSNVFPNKTVEARVFSSNFSHNTIAELPPPPVPLKRRETKTNLSYIHILKHVHMRLYIIYTLNYVKTIWKYINILVTHTQIINICTLSINILRKQATSSHRLFPPKSKHFQSTLAAGWCERYPRWPSIAHLGIMIRTAQKKHTTLR